MTPQAKADTHGWYWLQHPLVLDRVNTPISDSRHMDACGRGGTLIVIDAFEHTGFGYRDYGLGETVQGVSLPDDDDEISLTGEPWMRAELKECGLRVRDDDVRAWGITTTSRSPD